MPQPEVSILVPNYKTLELTQLCLRLLRKFTDPQKSKVIVVDNDSRDESLDYLRTLSWITLIERTAIPGESPPLSHSRALDLALASVKTPYVLSIHTDTLVRNAQWLDFLLNQMRTDSRIAGIGSWKLESKPLLKRWAKQAEQCLQTIYYRMIHKTDHAIEGRDHNHYYLRSHCALYRMDLIQKYGLNFSDGEEVAGKAMHRKLVEQGHKMIFLPSETLIQYLDHINHATMVLNPELGVREKSVPAGIRRIQKALAQFNATEILKDTSLDN